MSEENRSSERIENDIHRTQERIDRDIRDLGDRLHPRHLLNDAAAYVRDESHRGKASDSLRETGTRIAEEVRDEPAPIAVIGAGIAWYVWRKMRASSRPRRRAGSLPRGTFEEQRIRSARTSPSYQNMGSEAPWGPEWVSGEEEFVYGEEQPPGRGAQVKDKARDLKERGKEKAGELLGRGREKSEEFSDRSREKAGELKERGREKWSRTQEATSQKARELKERGREGLEHMQERADEYGHRARETARHSYYASKERIGGAIQESPLAMGLVTFVVGIIAGLLFPATRVEREAMGEPSRRFQQNVREKGEHAVERGADIAQKAATSATEEIKGEVGGSRGAEGSTASPV